VSKLWSLSILIKSAIMDKSVFCIPAREMTPIPLPLCGGHKRGSAEIFNVHCLVTMQRDVMGGTWDIHYRGNNLCNSKDSNYCLDARTPSVLDMLSKITFRRNHYAYPLHRADPQIDADAEETNVETPFPPSFMCHALYSFHPIPQSACCRKSYIQPHRFFKHVSLRSPIFFNVTPDGNDSRTRQMMKRKQTTQRTPKHAFRPCQILLQLRQLLQRAGGIS